MLRGKAPLRPEAAMGFGESLGRQLGRLAAPWGACNGHGEAAKPESGIYHVWVSPSGLSYRCLWI